MSAWGAQKQELETHNLLYSLINGYSDTGLIDLEYKLIGEKIEVPDPRQDLTIHPDYALYDGETVLFFRVMHGKTISSDVVSEMDRWPDIGLEAVKKYLKRAPVRKMNMEPSNAEQYDFCVVVREDLLESGIISEDRLAESFDAHCVLSVSPGGEAKLETSPLRDRALSSRLEDGVKLPERPPNNRSLTPNIDPESLAVAIAEDIGLTSLTSEDGEQMESQVSFSDVRRHFGEEIERARIHEVAQFLSNQNACRLVDDSVMEFRRSNITPLLEIESKVREKTVEEYLYGDSEQTSLGTW